MALKQDIVWTACPNGTAGSGGDLRLSVHIAPRLTGETTQLSSYPDFVNWGSTTQSFGVEIKVGANAPQLVSGVLGADVRRNDLWNLLFPGATPVTDRAAAKDYTDHEVISYPAGRIGRFLRDRQVEATLEHGTDLPDHDYLQGKFGSIGYAGGQSQQELALAQRQLAGERAEPGPGGRPKRANDFTDVDDERAFAALREFHRPRGRGPTEPITLPDIDFHRALALVGPHPRLQRLLGLVFDLTIPAGALSLGAPTTGTLRIVPGFTPGPGPQYTPITPRTEVVIGTGVLEPYTPSPDLNRRHLKIGNTSAFEVQRIDVDAGALKSAFFADSLALSRSPGRGEGQPANPAAPDAPTEYGLPTLRSAGFTVVQHERSTRFVRRIDRSRALTDGLDSTVPDLVADDLVRGYVLDVFDSVTNAWHSTGRRSGDYFFPTAVSGQSEPVDDEAAFDAPPTSPTDPDAPRQFHLQQSLARWDGWSLAGRRPGKALQQDGSTSSGIGSDPRFPIQFRLKPKPGSLPLLRFGRSYRLRMRAVDLAGNVVPLAEAAPVGDPDDRVTGSQRYVRHEPVASPDVLQRVASGAGESVLRLVVRGNFDADATEVSQRVLVPPRIAQPLAEAHGLFDVGGVPSKPKYVQIAGRESARYPDGGEISLTNAVPYLPDVLSRGVTLVPESGTLAGQQFAASFGPGGGGAWPDYRPFALALRHGAGQALTVDEGTRTATVTLAKADEITMRVSSSMALGDLAILGLFNWLSAEIPGGVPAATQALIAAGRYPTFTPFTTVTLVYAVRQPLNPSSSFPQALRALGDTYARIVGNLEYSRRSTSRIELRAAWNEVVDTGKGTPSGPGSPDPAGKNVDTVAFPVPIGQSSVEDQLQYDGRHEFGDTKHRVVTYRSRVTSRFAEYFRVKTEHKILLANGPTAFSSIGIEPGSVKVRSLDGKTEFQEGVAFDVNPATGTVTFKSPQPADTPQLNVNDTVRVEYLPPVSRETPVEQHRVVNVPSSARPATPVVVEAVPIFQWLTSTPGKNAKKSTRSRASIRVLLGRPWWSSGRDEALGVLTWPGAAGSGTGAVPDEVAPFVSDWGADPIWGGKPLPTAHPRQAAFTNSPPALRKTGLTIDERSGVLVDVAGHTVKFDQARDVWYSDIAIDTGPAYTPMVRLALARYQPSSINGVELSRIVLLDILQIAPGRALTVVRKSRTKIGSVQLTGISYGDGPYDVDGPGRAQVVIERKDTKIADPHLGWSRISVTPMTSSNKNGGQTTWTCGQIALPKTGKLRLTVQQFERARTDKRTQNVFALGSSESALKLVHQDVLAL